MVAEGDLKAFPGMNAITAMLEKEGAEVSRAIWSGQTSPEELASGVSTLLAEGNHIMCTALRKGTVVPPSMPDDGESNHGCTWRVAYRFESIRDWLFRQVRARGSDRRKARLPLGGKRPPRTGGWSPPRGRGILGASGAQCPRFFAFLLATSCSRRWAASASRCSRRSVLASSARSSSAKRMAS